MSKNYELLSPISLPSDIKTIQPPSIPELTHFDDPALDVLIDYSFHKPVMIDEASSIESALLEMKANDVHMLLVTNKNKELVGLTSSKTILGEKPYQIMEEKRIKHDEIAIHMLMLPLKDVLALDFDALGHAKIGDLIATFKAHKRHYAIVTEVDKATKEIQIRGYFSASRISKSLGCAFTGSKTGAADTILELKNMLKELK